MNKAVSWDNGQNLLSHLFLLGDGLSLESLGLVRLVNVLAVCVSLLLATGLAHLSMGLDLVGQVHE